jgi:hypothetical protein
MVTRGIFFRLRCAWRRSEWHLVFSLIGGVFLFAIPTVGQDAERIDPTTDVPIAVSENLGSLLSLKLQNDRLAPTICTNHEDAMAAFEAMGRNVSGGSSSGGDSRWQCFRMGQKFAMAGRYHVSPGGDFGDSADPWFVFEFIDRQSKGWRFRALANDDRRVFIRAIKRDGPDCFWFNQHANGAVFVVRISDQGIISAGGESFEQLSNQQASIAADLVFGELRKWGLSQLSGRFSSEVRQLMLKRFAEPDAERQAEFDRRVGELSDSQFQTREAASKWLNEKAADHLGMIIRALLSDGLPPEPRARLRRTLEAALSKTEQESFELIEKQKLADDPEMLVWLLDEPDSNSRPGILRQLELVSGESRGDDPQAWKDWLIATGKTVPSEVRSASSATPPEAYPAPTGKLLETATVVSDLLPLTSRDGRMQLDRQKWSAQFGGKTVRQLGEELHQYVAAQNLPADWLNIGKQLPEQLDYPHLIFPRLELADQPEKGEPRRNRVYYSQSPTPGPSLNLVVQSPELQASLEVQEGRHLAMDYWSSPTRDDAIALVVSISDEPNDAHSIFYGSWQGGAVNKLLVTGPNALVQIFQNQQRCVLDCAVGNASLHREFASADGLLADPHFVDKVAPFLKQYGLQLQQAGE